MDPREGVDRWKARGKFETGFKEQIVQEVDSGLLSVGTASRKYRISGSAIDRWRRQSRQGGLALLAGSSILLAVRKSDSSGFPVKRDSPQRPSAAKPQPKRRFNRKGRKERKGRALSFRTKREILVSSRARNLLLRSLAFARDDRPWACRLASLRLGASRFPCSSISAQWKICASFANCGANSGPCFTQKPEEPKKPREI